MRRAVGLAPNGRRNIQAVRQSDEDSPIGDLSIDANLKTDTQPHIAYEHDLRQISISQPQ